MPSATRLWVSEWRRLAWKSIQEGNLLKSSDSLSKDRDAGPHPIQPWAAAKRTVLTLNPLPWLLTVSFRVFKET